MSSLFIIGNGFDLSNRLSTRYCNFHKFLNQNYPDLENDMEEYFSFSIDDKYLWKDFENDLATFNYRNLFDAYNNIDVMSESFSPSEAFGLEDDISENVDHLIAKIKAAFTDWIEEIQLPTEKSNNLEFPENARFINFNCTDTLEAIYQMEESAAADEERDVYGNSNRTIFTDSENAARYPFYAFTKNSLEILQDKREFFNSLEAVAEITVLGHSLCRPDWPYLKELKKLFPDAIWRISYYGESELSYLRDTAIRENGIEARNIMMITIKEF